MPPFEALVTKDQVGIKTGIHRLTASRTRLRFPVQSRLRLAVKRRSYVSTVPKRRFHSIGVALLLGAMTFFGVVVGLFMADENPTAAGLEFFEKQVRPLLAEHCYACHSAKSKKLKAGLFVDSRKALLQGGDSGPAIEPNDVDGSLLIEAVRYESFEMPPKGKLPVEDIETLERWVEMGAPWPEESTVHDNAAVDTFDLKRRRDTHWVWQPIRRPAAPAVADRAWPRQDLDRFILARLDHARLAPSRQADRNALLRRLYFELIGLPPNAEQVQAFLDDESPGATERLVDQLLDSPHFGERWGRHWLDLVRYAESRGHEFDDDSLNAFQYRDYIIRAFNADVPYDQLVREHIAGDLVDPPRLHPTDHFNESVLGTGFWFLGEWVHSPVDIRKDETDRFDNMTDVMSKTFLGVTVACARCHDHKFDAILSADYYALSGFLQSSDYRQVRFESMEHNRRVAGQLAALDAEHRQQIEAAMGQRFSAPEREHEDAEVDAAVVVDYADVAAVDYLQDGNLFGSGPRLAGQPYLVESDGEPQLDFIQRSAAVSDSFWDGLRSINAEGSQSRSSISKFPRSGRTLRTPTFKLTDGNVVCRVRGSGHVVACVDSHRLIAGPLHGKTVQPIKSDQRWVRLNLDRYVGHRLHLEFTPDQDVQLEVSVVLQGASEQVIRQFEQREVAGEAAVAKWAEAAAQGLAEESETKACVDELVQSWWEGRRRLQDQIQHTSQLAMAMMDGTGEDDHILIRGSSSNPGNVVPRRFLAAVSGETGMSIPQGSGRLQLAEKINDPANPLASRVIVNRIWHHLMGRGIVPTTDDFGLLGLPPTHPDLLDHLASRFLAEGRSIKRMIRYIVLSRTYQMSAELDPQAAMADPKNRLWHYRPPRRLQGEAIRDSLLSISGRLDETMFGPSVPIHLTDFMEGRGRPNQSGPLDGAGRRSIYVAVRRNFLSPFMLTFDSPVPFSTMGRRNVSNVPAQALILMNDPFVAEQTKLWARRAEKTIPAIADSSAIAARIDWMYIVALARHPSDKELRVALEFLADQADDRGVDVSHSSLWDDLAHALVNTKEFIFLR
jgi:hypothetical protein